MSTGFQKSWDERGADVDRIGWESPGSSNRGIHARLQKSVLQKYPREKLTGGAVWYCPHNGEVVSDLTFEKTFLRLTVGGGGWTLGGSGS